MKKFLQISFIFIIFLSLSSCSSSDIEEDYLPNIDTPLGEMNKEIKLLAPTGWNTFTTNDRITLDVKVLSEHTVVFEPDLDSKVYLRAKNQWVEIDRLTYNPDELIYLSSKSSLGDPSSLSLFPILPDTTKPSVIRIVVSGKYFIDGKITDETIMAYIDISLKPQ